ncbi:MAG: hypothetical protein AB7F28_04885 [Candidatus Margulisiibacteriota bacterium]
MKKQFLRVLFKQMAYTEISQTRPGVFYSSTRNGFVSESTLTVTNEEFERIKQELQRTLGIDLQRQEKCPVLTLEATISDRQATLKLKKIQPLTLHFIEQKSPTFGGGMVNNVCTQRRLEEALGPFPLTEQTVTLIGRTGETILPGLFPLQTQLTSMKVQLRVLEGLPRSSVVIRNENGKEINIVSSFPLGEKEVPDSLAAPREALEAGKTARFVNNNMRPFPCRNIESLFAILDLKNEYRINGEKSKLEVDWRIGSNQLGLMRQFKAMETQSDDRTLRASYKKLFPNDKNDMTLAKLQTYATKANIKAPLFDRLDNDSEKKLSQFDDPQDIREIVAVFLKLYCHVFSGVDRLFLNAEEAQTLVETVLSPSKTQTHATRANTVLGLCREFRALGVDMVFITDAEHGAALVEPPEKGSTETDRAYYVPQPADSIADIKDILRKHNCAVAENGNSKGCGDAFAAALDFSLHHTPHLGWPRTQHLVFAQYVASIVYCLDEPNLLNVPPAAIQELLGACPKS